MVYYWQKSSTINYLENRITLTANSDIYLTGFECLASLPVTKQHKFKFNEVTGVFEMQPSTSLQLDPEDFWEANVSINPYYLNIDTVRSVRTKFGYQRTFKYAQFIPKGVEVYLRIVLTSKEPKEPMQQTTFSVCQGRDCQSVS